jgi:hypothetical protein
MNLSINVLLFFLEWNVPKEQTKRRASPLAKIHQMPLASTRGSRGHAVTFALVLNLRRGECLARQVLRRFPKQDPENDTVTRLTESRVS